MNTVQKTLLTLVAATTGFMTTGANAYTGDMGFHVGAKAGQLMVDEDRLGDKDKPITYGVYAGLNFDQNFGAEVEYLRSQKVDEDNSIAKVTYDTQALGAYGTYRYYLPNTPFYGKGKLGAVYQKSELNYTSKATNNKVTADKKEDETTYAAGLGLGFQPTDNIGVEAEYTKIGKDKDGLVSVGLHLKF